MSWEFGARHKDRTGSRTQRLTVTFSEENWAFIHGIAALCECSIAEVIHDAITHDRKRTEASLEIDEVPMPWKRDG